MDKIRQAGNIDESTPLHATMYNCTDASHSYIIGYFSPNSGAPELGLHFRNGNGKYVTETWIPITKNNKG